MTPSHLPPHLRRLSWTWNRVFEGSGLEFRLIAFNQAHNDEFFRVNGYYTKIGDVFPPGTFDGANN